jgi:hypothetical protein
MPSARITCPQCHGISPSTEPIPAGKRLECQKCGRELSAGDARAARPAPAAPQPTRAPTAAEDSPALGQRSRVRRPPRPGRGPAARGSSRSVVLLVGLVLGGLLLVGLGAGALWVAFKGARAMTQPSSLDDPRVTQETFEGVNAELTLAELEARLGPGRKVSFEELPLADRPAPGKQERAELERLAGKYRIRSWYLWTGRNRWAFAGFRTSQSSIVGWYFKKPDGGESSSLHDSENTLP